ncbi:YncE family protein [Geomicrobium sediminis]|uniref:DNA-binding beta-propeller fold protein YncE n=1 Tax=Geomicrobium sediminis TaxID=1347788 RepID=A0ABS2PB78_9BACL|nr:YncE family protein [Geomicrobium sediminis]MBM7632335.1 DNA-binding beta-propeller fold protein YncE [Geomicrobium sediminis]
MKKRITINNNLINGPGNISPIPPLPPTSPTFPTQPTQPTPPVPPLEDLLFIGRSGGITVYDVSRRRVITEIENVGTPNDIFINSEMNLLYVTSSLGLSVLNLSDYQLIAQTPVPSGINEIGYNPTNNTVYAGADFRAFGFDPDNNYQLSTTIDVTPSGASSGMFALNPLTNRGYLPIGLADNVYVLDLLTNTWVDTVITSPSASGLVAVNSTTNRIYTSNSSTPSRTILLDIIDGNTNTVTTTIALAEPENLSTGIAIDEINNRIYVSNRNTNNASNVLAYVVDGNTNTLLDTITIDRNVNTSSITVNPSVRRAYISDAGNDIIYVIDTISNTVVEELPFQSFVLAAYTP